MIHAMLKLPRRIKQVLMLSFDICAVIFCLIASFSIRLEQFFFPNEGGLLLFSFFAAPILLLPIFVRFGLYHNVTRYLGLKDIWIIIQAVSLYAILWGLITFMVSIEGIPRSVILLNWLLLIMIICGSRFFIRWLLSPNNTHNNVIIYGAGSAGRQLSRALTSSTEYNPVAFIDDESKINHHTVEGLKVYSRVHLKTLIEKKNVKELFLAIPSISRTQRRGIIDYLEPFPVGVRVLPSVSDLAKGKVQVNDLLEVDISDLLGRESVVPNQNLLKVNITEKVVLITGAGGSIGSELCRQILSLKPRKIVLYEISESSLYIIEQELINLKFSDVEIFPVIGSVGDETRMTNICKYYGVQTIYHAAAYKHVPLVESNQSQGILNNSFGTLAAARAAISSNVKTFVLISTDKAVRPVNIMGASKRIAELILQALSKQSHSTCFTMVRFGNVLNSSGSVIPLFKKQIKEGGPVTVTHRDIVRYFMSIPEAVELVIQAGAMAKGGEVFILDMGKPTRIYDLALKMINLSGLQVRDENNPNGDIEIQYTGLRPGEKLYEELLVGGEFTITENNLIMCAEEEMINWDILEPLLIEIKEASINNNEKTHELLHKLVPGFKHKK